MKQITVKELHDNAYSPDVILVDVRTPAEYKEVRAKGAVNVPLDTFNLEAVTSAIGADRLAGKDVYVICKSGGRSSTAIGTLPPNTDRFINVAGGTMAWVEAGYPVEQG